MRNWPARLVYVYYWRQKHRTLMSAGLTGDYGHLRKQLETDMMTPEPIWYTGLLYQTIKEFRPKTCIEIGVQRGCSTFAILRALHDNDYGELHSIDLMPDVFFGRLVAPVVPGYLKDRWHYHEGESKKVLPGLLEELGTVDFAFHDADHSLEGQYDELRQLWEHGAKALWVDYLNGNFAEYWRRLDPKPREVRTLFKPAEGVCEEHLMLR